MAYRNLVYLLFWMTIAAGPVTARADYITISGTADIKIEGQTARVALELENLGDEAAQQVDVELPALAERYPVTERLAPKEKASASFEVPLVKLAGETSAGSTSAATPIGSFHLYTRIRYRDSNSFPASIVVPLAVDVPPIPAQVLLARLDRENPVEPIELTSSEGAEVLFRNISGAPITITSIEAFTPAEVQAKTRTPVEEPLVLAPQEKRSIAFELENVGALPGSQYYVPIVFGGLVGDRHFSELLPMVIHVAHPTSPTKSVLTVVVALLVILSIGAIFLRKSRTTGR